jgi:hypothetical protein
MAWKGGQTISPCIVAISLQVLPYSPIKNLRSKISEDGSAYFTFYLSADTLFSIQSNVGHIGLLEHITHMHAPATGPACYEQLLCAQFKDVPV